MPKDNEVDEKVIPEGAVAVVSGVWSIMWAGDRSVAHVATKHNLAIGDYLYSPATVAELLAKADAAERRAGELEALLAAIRPYAQHDDACGDMDAYNNATIESCGCGLDSLLDAASEALTGADPK